MRRMIDIFMYFVVHRHPYNYSELNATSIYYRIFQNIRGVKTSSGLARSVYWPIDDSGAVCDPLKT